jgi:UDP-N-acetylmuramyl pentapeptide synthase
MSDAIATVVGSIAKRRAWYFSLLAMRAAVAYRPCLRRVSFIGVTGSCGKTTTKELIATIAGTSGKGRKSVGNNNVPQDLARIILKARPWDAFCVLSKDCGDHERSIGSHLSVRKP